MIRKIAVIGEEGLADSLNEATEEEGILFEALDEKHGPSSGTSAVLAPSGHSKQALGAAVAIAKEYDGLLNLVADAVGCREGIPLGDSKRVVAHAARFGVALGLNREDQFAFERAALLRDIGKIKIPNDILLKKSVLDYDEWTLLKAHSRLGAELLLERGVCTDVVEIVESHHECYDGDGYPDHLEREEIPYLGRAMRIVDVYCAMTSPRFYRKSFYTRDEAFEYLRSERSKHFDPEMVDLFTKGDVAEEA